LSPLGRPLCPHADQQKPRPGHHEDERRHHPDANKVEARRVSEKEDERPCLLRQKAGEAPERPQQNALVGAASGLPDAGVQNRLDHHEHTDEFHRHGLAILPAHEHEGAADEDGGQSPSKSFGRDAGGRGRQ